jgi:hypothetical protein
VTVPGTAIVRRSAFSPRRAYRSHRRHLSAILGGAVHYATPTGTPADIVDEEHADNWTDEPALSVAAKPCQSATRWIGMLYQTLTPLPASDPTAVLAKTSWPPSDWLDGLASSCRGLSDHSPERLTSVGSSPTPPTTPDRTRSQAEATGESAMGAVLAEGANPGQVTSRRAPIGMTPGQPVLSNCDTTLTPNRAQRRSAGDRECLLNGARRSRRTRTMAWHLQCSKSARFAIAAR